MKTDKTLFIEESLFHHLNPKNDPRIYIAKEVTYWKEKGQDDLLGPLGRVDMMRFKPVNQSISGVEKGDFYAYEIKVTLKDFHSPNGHNFIGDFNYYVVPEELVQKLERKDIPFGVGLIAIDDNRHAKTIYNARRQDRHHSTAQMLLLMFRSCNRENFKKGNIEHEGNVS